MAWHRALRTQKTHKARNPAASQAVMPLPRRFGLLTFLEVAFVDDGILSKSPDGRPWAMTACSCLVSLCFKQMNLACTAHK